jgi:signal transduction histidine kinase
LATLGVLHDLNNMLLTMGLAAAKDGDSAEREAGSQAAKLVRLLQSLHCGAPIVSGSVDVAHVVTRLLPLARALALRVSSVARIELGCLDEAAARCAPALVERALIGLVTNSGEATIRSGSVIRIDVEADECEVRLRVTDDGPGVANHLVPRLFERGFSTKGSAERGTGLASLREAARRARGDLRFVPRTTGATFVLALPRA